MNNQLDHQMKQAETSTSTTNHIVFIEDILTNSQKLLLNYKKDIDILKFELTQMKQEITYNNENTKSSIIPETEALLNELMTSISIQKEENNIQQQSIKRIKNDLQKSQLNINQNVQNTENLENQVWSQ